MTAVRSNMIFTIGVNHLSNKLSRDSIPTIGDEDKHDLYLKMLSVSSIDSFMVLSTCNRLEFYGIGDKEVALKKYNEVLGEHSNIIPFVYTGDEAILHLFQMVSGIKSQLIGDLEIIGQFKKAVTAAKEIGGISGYFERLADSCIKTAKLVRKTTNISDGTTSLSYAVIEYLKNEDLKGDKEVLLLGTGDFGTKIARNLIHYFPNNKLALSNRTKSKAIKLGEELGCVTVDFGLINENAHLYDIVITTISNLTEPLITSHPRLKNKVIVDLSTPSSIDNEVSIDNTIVSNEDLSEIINKTLYKRNADLPKVHDIISNEIDIFKGWSDFYQKSESARLLKSDVLEKSTSCPFLKQVEPEVVTEFVNEMIGSYVQFIKKNETQGIPKEELPLEYIKQNKNAFSKVLSDVTKSKDL